MTAQDVEQAVIEILMHNSTRDSKGHYCTYSISLEDLSHKLSKNYSGVKVNDVISTLDKKNKAYLEKGIVYLNVPKEWDEH